MFRLTLNLQLLPMISNQNILVSFYRVNTLSRSSYNPL